MNSKAIDIIVSVAILAAIGLTGYVYHSDPSGNSMTQILLFFIWVFLLAIIYLGAVALDLNGLNTILKLQGQLSNDDDPDDDPDGGEQILTPEPHECGVCFFLSF